MATETEWRRRWKPDLVSCPWQSVEVDDDNYLIKVKFSEESYEVLITDLMSFWHEALDGPSLKQRIEVLHRFNKILISYYCINCYLNVFFLVNTLGISFIFFSVICFHILEG